MFDSMNGHIVNTFVEIGLFDAVSVFFHQAKGSFDAGSERLQFLIDGAVR